MKKHTFWTPAHSAINAREARALCRAQGTTLRAVKRAAHQKGSINPHPYTAPVGVGFGA